MHKIKLDNILSDYLGKIGILEQHQKEQCKQVQRKEAFNKRFWDYTFVVAGKHLISIVDKISNSFYGYFIKEDNIGYHVGCTLPKEGEFLNHGYDRSLDAIDLFSKVYERSISESNIKKSDLDKGIRNFKFQGNKSIEISGDIDFNFKMNHIRYFIDIINNGKSEMAEAQKMNLKKILIKFHNLTYHPNNISLLPRTGALNNIKKSLGNDRLDTILFALKLYYEKGITSFILSSSCGPNPPYIANRNKLKEFLDSFNCGSNNSESIYSYCNQIYHIDENLVNDLCLSGSKPIDTPERVEDYLDLATRFWAQKNEFYKRSNSKVKSQYQKMMKEIIEARGLEYYNSFTGTKNWNC